ncbi:GH25 family lysozyme M1 (1,4-beta-N-acetylmuramidase) [Lactobacillus colini]|uniref:GH25 family lysozyme M1 (1,4-beta-N-acetylmuramidase) n=1 Tax=Lactobacillus colini TaxID=1819254 RepID=A0ABS4MBJ0_9LACO|nr:GH25 family lysozyme [Lactobacillus colini]MBP2057029.1 GH25 family lysozyme M1 (1,4-beta-N-acetylmuramidase) [Lactobacillus colini]
MTSRKIVIDMASYQAGLTIADYKMISADYGIVKISEGTNYVNTAARQIINCSAAGGIKGFAFYHFSRFTTVAGAKAEAEYFIKQAKAIANIQPGTLLIDDAEIQGMTTDSHIAFLKTLREAGYHTGFYTYKYMLPQFNMKEIMKYADFFWLAAYPLGNGVKADKNPNFAYFPSADKVDLWQYTDNLLGFNVDGSISLTDNAIKLFNPSKVKSTWVKESGTFILGESLKIHESPHIDSPAIAKLPKGSVIKYDATLQGPLRLWLRQPRSGGKYGYIVGKDKYGKALGKFK